MSLQAKVYIIILNYNGWKDTIECIESLLQLDYKEKHIIVVDNKSPNNSFSHLLDWASKAFAPDHTLFSIVEESHVPDTALSPESLVTFVQASHNGGFAAGNNIGIRLALQQKDCDYLWLLNNDTTVAKDSLSELVKRAQTAKEQGQKIGIWGSKLLYYHQPNIIQAVGGKFDLSLFTSRHIGENAEDNGQFNLPNVEQDYVVGASMFVSTAFVQEVGLLNENYFLYFEELDWATRAKLHGYALGYVWSSKVFHKEGKTIGSSSEGGKKSALADYHGIRSKIIFIRKYYPKRILQLYILLSGSVILRLRRLQFKRAAQVLSLMLKTT